MTKQLEVVAWLADAVPEAWHGSPPMEQLAATAKYVAENPINPYWKVTTPLVRQSEAQAAINAAFEAGQQSTGLVPHQTLVDRGASLYSAIDALAQLATDAATQRPGEMVLAKSNEPERHRQIGICDEGHEEFWTWIRKAYRDAEETNSCFSHWNMQVAFKAGWMQALATPPSASASQAEPVAWMNPKVCFVGGAFRWHVKGEEPDKGFMIPLYTAATQARPASGEAKPLTADEVIAEFMRPVHLYGESASWFEAGVRFAERAHGIGPSAASPGTGTEER